MDKEAIGVLIGILTVMAGFVRWLLSFYFKKEAEIEKLKKKLTDEVLSDLKSTVEDHKKELRLIKEKLDTVSIGYKSNQEGFKAITDSLRNYIDVQEGEIAKIKHDIKYLTDDVISLKISRKVKNGK